MPGVALFNHMSSQVEPRSSGLVQVPLPAEPSRELKNLFSSFKIISANPETTSIVNIYGHQLQIRPDLQVDYQKADAGCERRLLMGSGAWVWPQTRSQKCPVR